MQPMPATPTLLPSIRAGVRKALYRRDFMIAGLSVKQQARAIPAGCAGAGRDFRGREAPDSPGKACGGRVQAQHKARCAK
jgi:hypothetical protein